MGILRIWANYLLIEFFFFILCSCNFKCLLLKTTLIHVVFSISSWASTSHPHHTCGQQRYVSNSEIVAHETWQERGRKQVVGSRWENSSMWRGLRIIFYIYIVGGVHGQHKEESITVRGSHPMVVGNCSWLEGLFMLDTWTHEGHDE